MSQIAAKRAYRRRKPPETLPTIRHDSIVDQPAVEEEVVKEEIDVEEQATIDHRVMDEREMEINSMKQDSHEQFSAEMVASIRAQSGMEVLQNGSNYLHCIQHGFVPPVDICEKLPMCSICGSKMVYKKYLI